MNECLVKRWNSVVTNNDIVWHGGDFTLGSWHTFLRFANQLNAKQINFIPGNHDYRWIKNFDANYVRYKLMDHIVHKKDANIVLSHYPMLSWHKSYGYTTALHLHGHCHGNVGKVSRSGDAELAGYRVDIGVDCWDYYPVTMKQIRSRIRETKV